MADQPARAERARPHPIPPARWPSRSEARASLLFSPLALGPVTARTRTWVPAMVPWRASEDGLVTAEVLDWYRRFADGRPGVLVVEATGIRDVPSGPLLRIGHDRFVPGLAELVAAVRAHSRGRTRLLIQIIDFLAIRRRPTVERFVSRYLELGAHHRERLEALPGMAERARRSDAEVRAALLELPHAELLALLEPRERESLEMGYRERVTDTHLPHVAELPAVLPGLFAAAAARAERAGFDGVELHFAHAYTLASFLSRTNDRRDGYGGSREGRVRLPLEVYRAVRAAVGHGFAVGARFLGDEAIAGGSDVEDAAWFGERFARAGMDFLSISKGGKFDDARQPKVGEAAYPYTGPSGHECMPTVRIDPYGLPTSRGPFGRNLHLASRVRAAVRAAGLGTPVVASGGINSFELAEAALRGGHCDAVGAARQTLADPDWFLKVELGRGSEVRRCVYTNYCEGLDQRHKQVTCQLWDRQLELPDPAQAPWPFAASAPRLALDGKRRLLAPAWRADEAASQGRPPPNSGSA
jgi:2,4-dienoyl-CoA reductase-like NADH-dependent reductase (Old Yellow Enzyme family)